MAINQNLLDSLTTGHINAKLTNSKEHLRPQLITNNPSQGEIVLSSIIQHLEDCEAFWFSVAFITTGGLATIMNTLIALEKKNIKGYILTSQYLNFTQPEALKRLLQFKNIELKIAVDTAFHAKGYIFKTHEGLFDIILGSSNLTDTALKTNKEWNLKVTATAQSELYKSTSETFQKEFELAVQVDQEFIANYSTVWQNTRESQKQLNQTISSDKAITPNTMQQQALKNIEALRADGKNKALLISATGTGKTFLSAFDVQAFKPKRFLFVVHRLNIAEAAMKTYQTIFGNEVTMGVYSGSQREINAQFIFSTVQTLSREQHMRRFDKDHFDYIVIDETHRAGANSYTNIMAYFTPKFLLGMTATPERTDGVDIFKLFDHNLAYEIRLHQALEENMLCPFHYYGVTDLTVDNEEINDLSSFNKLTDEARVKHIINYATKFGCDNGETRGLIFCAKNDIALALSNKFNALGYKTIALSGSNTEEERKEAINRLESKDPVNKLDYIFTVDIFNEGIDIPCVNQIIMLRPTQSAIVFVQQLGRGLRKLNSKSYLTVIDFIGNYNNNYLVPIALFGDNSYNKDTLRNVMTTGNSLIPGTSTVNFDEISREKIFKAINQANMQTKKGLVADYKALKHKLGRIPMMVDFINYGSRDPFLYVAKYKSYYNFVKNIETQHLESLNKQTCNHLEYISKEIANAKRVEESILLKALIEEKSIKASAFKEDINNQYGYIPTPETLLSCVRNLNFNFIKKEIKMVCYKNELFEPDQALTELISNPRAKTFVLDALDYSIKTFNKTYKKETYKEGLVLYNKYSRKDVCRVLNWPKDISSTVYGYRTVNQITPCFVTYKKANDISESTMYNDHFIDHQTFAWESRSNRRLESDEIKKVINSKRILLFVKKEDGEGTDFYYVGDATIIDNSIEQGQMASGQPVVHFKYKLHQPVKDSLYKYLIN